MTPPPTNAWDEHAQDWDDDPAARAYASAAFASLLPILDHAGVDLASASVIDFGCGTGLLTERLVAAGAAVDAVDTSAAMLEVLAAKVIDQRWRDVRTSTSLPGDHSAFDLVVCSSVCSFLDDYPASVVELAACLRSGGLFVQWDWERGDDESHGLTRGEIHDALSAAGLVDIEVATAFSISVCDTAMAPLMAYGSVSRPGPRG